MGEAGRAGWLALSASIILVGALVYAGAVDVVLLWGKVEGNTVSDVILNVLQRHPIIAVGLGVLIGHLVWPQYR